jgi:hypothetical protein
MHKRLIRATLLVVGATLAVIAPAALAGSDGAVVLRGSDSQNVRPFVLKQDADVAWSCPGCGESNFIFSTDQEIPVNALGVTHGSSFLERGRYTGVSISADGPWTIRMTASKLRPVRRTYTLRGVDSQKVRPFTLTHDSDVIWACGGCSDSNFIFATDQDIPVNALNSTHGKSFLERGRYTSVSISADGPWTIVLR